MANLLPVLDEKNLALKKERQISFGKLVEQMADYIKISRRAGESFIPYLLDSKMIAHDFAKKVGLSVPKIYKADVPIEQIQFLPNTVIKPMRESSSVGVFITNKTKGIRYIKKGVDFVAEKEAKAYATKLLKENMVRKDSWICEQLITHKGSIARDVKFYMFYGKVGLCLETKRLPKVERCWYDSTGKAVRTGKYENVLFEGEGQFSQAEAVAKMVSRLIPSPFFRVDFLISDNDVYFGEITPVPANSNGFNDEWDLKLGQMLIDAAMRISQDVATGKKFDAIMNIEKNPDTIIKKINSGLF